MRYPVEMMSQWEGGEIQCVTVMSCCESGAPCVARYRVMPPWQRGQDEYWQYVGVRSEVEYNYQVIGSE